MDLNYKNRITYVYGIAIMELTYDSENIYFTMMELYHSNRITLWQ